MIARAGPWMRRLAMLVATSALALVSACILGPKQDDPAGGNGNKLGDSGTFATDASASDAAPPNPCSDDGSHGSDAATRDAACPGSADSGTFDGAADAKADAKDHDAGAGADADADGAEDARTDAAAEDATVAEAGG